MKYPPYTAKKGVIKAIKRVKSQLRSTAMLSPLSVMISAMYSQGMGPRENSNRTTNNRIKIMHKVFAESD